MQENPSQAIIEAGRWIQSRHWCPATGGNFSARLNDNEALITESGCQKGELTTRNLLQVDLHGTVLSGTGKPSAETLLHTRLYQLDNHIGAVLHTHSVASTVLSRIETGACLSLSGYEMQKSLAGNTTHEAQIEIAILDNHQDMAFLSDQLAQRWQETPLKWGFLVRGHGLYSWGRDMQEARRHLEGLEFLFACELELRRLGKL